MVEVTELGELCDFIRGVTFDKAEATDYPREGALPVLRAGNIGRELNTQTDLVWVSGKRISLEQKLRKDDVAICMSSGSPEVVGKTARVRQDFNGSIGSFCGIIRPKLADEAAMVAYFFQSEMFRKYRDDIARGANIQNLRFSQFEEIRVPRPENSQRLAALLDKADHLRRTRRYAQQLSDTFLQSVFLEMFGDPATNPKGWDIVAIEEALSKRRAGTQSGPFGSSLKRHEYVAEWIPVWGINNVKPNEFIEDEPLYITAAKYQQLTTYSVEVGDILISRAGTTGRMCVARPMQSPSIIGTNLVRVSLNCAKIGSDYFTALFTYLPNRVGSLRTSGDENAYSFLNPSNLRQLRIPLPPHALQEQFAQVVRRTERLRGQQREAARQAEHLFQTLLARAFRGEA